MLQVLCFQCVTLQLSNRKHDFYRFLTTKCGPDGPPWARPPELVIFPPFYRLHPTLLMPPVNVTRTYLELTEPALLRAAEVDPQLQVVRVHSCPPSFFRYLYGEVGRNHHWKDRLGWTDAEIAAYLATPGVALWVAWLDGAPAGYFELRQTETDDTEIVYFGLIPERTGHGWGKQLLTLAVRQAWTDGARRVWLHTCTLDSPHAMPNYQARGFVPFREERYTADLDDAPRSA